MPRERTSKYWSPTTVAISLLAVVTVLFGALVAFIGLPTIFVPAHMLGEPPAAATSVLQTSNVGYVFLLSGTLTLFGVIRDRANLTWLGAIATAAFACLGIFGTGALMIPVGLALVVLMLVRMILDHWPARVAHESAAERSGDLPTPKDEVLALRLREQYSSQADACQLSIR